MCCTECKKGRIIKVMFSSQYGFSLYAMDPENTQRSVCYIGDGYRGTVDEAMLMPLRRQDCDDLIKCNGNGSCFL